MDIDLDKILELLKAWKEKPESMGYSTDYYDSIWPNAHALAEAQYQPAKDFFLKGFDDPDWLWRHDCVAFVGLHYPLKGENEVVEKIRTLLLNDPSSDVRISAASVLGVQSSFPDKALITALQSDPNPIVRKSAFDSILHLAGVSYKTITQELGRIKSGEIKPSIQEVERVLTLEGITYFKKLEQGPTMTHLLYQTNSYLKTFDATIVAIDAENHAIALDQTAFYPTGGGQPCDYGKLTVKDAVYTVSKVKKVGDLVFHYIEGDAPLPVEGETVHGEIDWAHRHQLMRTHTAMHILCGVIFRDYGASVTGGDMDPLNGRMDFEFETMHKELVADIQAAVNQEIANARPVRVSILPREEAFQIPDLIRTKINLLPPGIPQVRVVEIVGLDLQADGGTHVSNTSEVGHIRVVDYKSKGKINKRIYIEVTDAA